MKIDFSPQKWRISGDELPGAGQGSYVKLSPREGVLKRVPDCREARDGGVEVAARDDISNIVPAPFDLFSFRFGAKRWKWEKAAPARRRHATESGRSPTAVVRCLPHQ